MMRELIESFPAQVEHAWQNAAATVFKGDTSNIQNVIVTGLGGSGIGGKIIAQIIEGEARVPIVVNNDYLLPAFAGSNTLVVVSSYSGNTEETLSAMKDALTRGCRVVCISSGGQITALALSEQLDLVVIPGGEPPRSQFGYSAISLMRVFAAYGIASDERFEAMKSLGTFLKKHASASAERAARMAKVIGDKSCVIYAENRNEGVATRWRQQLNENSKRLCWHHVYPEMNHNELVGWESGDERIAVLLLRSDDDHPRSVARMNITEEIFLKRGAHVENVIALGKSRIERVFDLIHLGDHLSLVLAENDGIDPVSIESIDYLKDALSRIE